MFIAEGAKGNKCIKVTTTLGDPVNPTPHPTDLAKWPWPHNASSCGGDGTTSNCWSMLQPLMEGDYVADVSINPYYATELMRVGTSARISSCGKDSRTSVTWLEISTSRMAMAGLP